jgi:hypothetical protein
MVRKTKNKTERKKKIEIDNAFEKEFFKQKKRKKTNRPRFIIILYSLCFRGARKSAQSEKPEKCVTITTAGFPL